MSRQNNQPAERDRKSDGLRKDAASSTGRYAGNEKNFRPGYDRNNNDTTNIAALNRNRLNDLYERSSF